MAQGIVNNETLGYFMAKTWVRPRPVWPVSLSNWLFGRSMRRSRVQLSLYGVDHAPTPGPHVLTPYLHPTNYTQIPCISCSWRRSGWTRSGSASGSTSRRRWPTTPPTAGTSRSRYLLIDGSVLGRVALRSVVVVVARLTLSNPRPTPNHPPTSRRTGGWSVWATRTAPATTWTCTARRARSRSSPRRRSRSPRRSVLTMSLGWGLVLVWVWMCVDAPGARTPY